jgi:MFS family permease
MDKNREFSRSKWFILILFGLIGQIAWAVENMYFNLFVFETVAPSLETVTLMVQLSGVTATVVTLIAGTVSDKTGNRRAFISWGYIIWGVTVALFGFLSPDLIQSIFGLEIEKAITLTLALVVVADCVMTVFGSTANDAAFNAWVTDNTEPSYRGKVEGVLSILPLIALLVVAGGFGIIVGAIGYDMMFLALGILISACGVLGIVYVKDKDGLSKSGSMKDIFYGFKPSVIKGNAPFYVSLLVILVYGIACQIFMPYMVIYMSTYLQFSVIEYSAVFAIAILGGAGLNLFLTRLSDKMDKVKLLYVSSAIMAAGLLFMYFSKGGAKIANLILFGLSGFVMITGYIFTSALCGSTIRDYTPEGEVGKLQGVRMVFSVLIPMLIGPMIGNAINAKQNIPLPDMDSADTMTTSYIPAPEIFLVASIVMLVIFAVIPVLAKVSKNKTGAE